MIKDGLWRFPESRTIVAGRHGLAEMQNMD
jgi:hypothetical protein